MPSARQFRWKPWQFLAAVAVLVGGAAYAIHQLRQQPIRSDSDMVALLPRADATVFYADVSVLRRVGILQLLAGSPSLEEPEYQAFLRETNFDFAQDIDTVAASLQGPQLFFVVRGHFDWTRLRRYALAHGGTCHDDLCDAPTSKPGHWASFEPIQSNVLALAVGPNEMAAKTLQPSRRYREAPPLPAQPVWVSIGPSLLKNVGGLPPALQIFAAPLGQAERVIFSIGGTSSAWSLQLSAQCETDDKARRLRQLLEDRTRLFERAVLRQQQKPDPTDLTSLALEGKFEQNGNRVVGSWPLRKELLDSLR